MAMRRMDHIGRHHQIFIDELRRIAVVGMNAAHPRRRQHHLIGAFCGKKGLHRRLIGQIQLGAGAGDQLQVGAGRLAGLQLAQDGAAHHAAMACHIDLDHRLRSPR